MNRLMGGASLLAITAFTISLPAIAQSADGAENRRLKTVTVTATKRTESAQNIPVTVNALGE